MSSHSPLAATVALVLAAACAATSAAPPANQSPPPTGLPVRGPARGKPNYLETSHQITRILNEIMSPDYDKRVRPNYGGPPVEVNVTMRILSISSVSEVMMDFTADFYFRQTWHDPRLSFQGLHDIRTLYVGAEVSKKIWLPDTFFGNEKMAYFHEATTPNVFLRIDHSGEVYRSIRLTVTSSCPMNLQYFPMDRQRCTIEAESYGYNVKDIVYRWAHNDTAVERDKTISLPQFDIVQTIQMDRVERLTSGNYSRLIAEIHFARRMGYYLIQIYIPSSLIVVISWVSFWLHRNASPARVQLGVTTVLTMTTLMSSTNAALPKISYVKSIDIFLGTCFVMVFAALLEYATVGYLGKRIAMRKAHAQHAQSQAQARLFAHLQAQGAQGELAGASPSSAGTSLNIFSTSGPGPELALELGQAAAAAAAADGASQGLNSPLKALLRDQSLLMGVVASQPQPQPQPQPMAQCAPRANPLLTDNIIQTAACQRHSGEDEHLRGQQQRHLAPADQLACCKCNSPAPVPVCQAHRAHHSLAGGNHEPCPLGRHQHNHRRPPQPQHQQQRHLNQHLCAHQHACATHRHDHELAQPQAPPRKFKADLPLAGHHQEHATSCVSCNRKGSQTLPRNLTFAPEQQQQQQQLLTPVTFQTARYHSSAAAPTAAGPPSSKGASAAAAQAAATFVSLHRKNKGLPPSTNPNFAQFNSIINPPYNRHLETIFGIRPSDIDKYSRVVFPVCFVCFQLMYWIVYLHISAFLEPSQQQQQ